MPLRATDTRAPEELEEELEEELDEVVELLDELDELELLRVFLLVLPPFTTGVEGSVPVLVAVFLPPPPPQAVNKAKTPATPQRLTLAAPTQFH